jgi:Zn-dependent protease with chaperone function
MTVDLIDHGEKLVRTLSLSPMDFVNPYRPHLLQLPLRQAPLHKPFPRAVHRFPTGMEKRFGLSVQKWGSWTWDWVKAELIELVIFTILIWLLYLVIHRSPRRWWFYFWLISLPHSHIRFLYQSLGDCPLFNKFEPLQQKNPELTAALEKMVHRAGEDIPPERIFWMGAAEKTTGLNAYVTGIGASKRIVVWDTTIAKMNTPQIVFVAGHEMGALCAAPCSQGDRVFSLPRPDPLLSWLSPDRMVTAPTGRRLGHSQRR